MVDAKCTNVLCVSLVYRYVLFPQTEKSACFVSLYEMLGILPAVEK